MLFTNLETFLKFIVDSVEMKTTIKEAINVQISEAVGGDVVKASGGSPNHSLAHHI